MNNQTIDNIIDQLDEYARNCGEFYGLRLDHREKMQAIIGSITNIEPKLSGIKHERMNALSVTNWINKKIHTTSWEKDLMLFPFITPC